MKTKTLLMIIQKHTEDSDRQWKRDRDTDRQRKGDPAVTETFNQRGMYPTLLVKIRG